MIARATHAAAVALLLATTLAAAASDARGLVAYVARDGDKILAERNADLLLQPASVQKVVVAACALELLGPDHTIVTRITADAKPDAGGVLAGDLVLHGAGDPTWSARFFSPADHPLEKLAAAVAARGVRVVEGDLVLDLGLFPPPAQPRSRPLAELALGWAAPVSALAVDENVTRLHMAPGKVIGSPPIARWIDDPPGAPELVIRAYTVGPERHDHGTVAFLPLWDRGALLLEGEYPISEPPYDVPVAVPDPARPVAARFRAALARHGVVVHGVDRSMQAPVGFAQPVASWRSPPLVRWLAPILEDSHNWYAEMLLRQVAVGATGSGRLEDGLAAVEACWVDRAGAQASDFVLDDGSGLSADNLMTARALAQLLAWAWRQPWHEVFASSLAAPGKGTLRGWPSLPPLVGKTGSKRHTQALAGYLHPSTSRPVVFVVLLDHSTDTRSARRAEVAGWVTRFGLLDP